MFGSTAGEFGVDAGSAVPVVDFITVATDEVTECGVDSSTRYYLSSPCLAYVALG